MTLSTLIHASAREIAAGFSLIQKAELTFSLILAQNFISAIHSHANDPILSTKRIQNESIFSTFIQQFEMSSDSNLEKRREQNRRAQRKHRAKVQELIRLRRKGEGGCQEVEKGKGVDKGFTTIPNSDTKKNINDDQIDFSNFIQSLLVRAMSPIQSSKICLPRFQLVQALYTNAERMGVSTPILTNYWSISTIQLGWKNKLMNKNHSQNQILDSIHSKEPLHQSSKTCLTVQDHESIEHWRFDRIPQNMFPTSAQLTIEHHPYIDCF